MFPLFIKIKLVVGSEYHTVEPKMPEGGSSVKEGKKKPYTGLSLGMRQDEHLYGICSFFSIQYEKH